MSVLPLSPALLPPFPACCSKSSRGGGIHRPGRIFYLFNYVAQQNLIVNKKEICYILFKLCLLVVIFYAPLSFGKKAVSFICFHGIRSLVNNSYYFPGVSPRCSSFKPPLPLPVNQHSIFTPHVSLNSAKGLVNLCVCPAEHPAHSTRLLPSAPHCRRCKCLVPHWSLCP